MITVYSKPNCPQCDMTKNYFIRKGIEFKSIDLTEDTDSLTRLKEAGHRQAPVVEADNYVWSGYRPDMIEEYLESIGN